MKYPIGIQDFRELRTEGYVYIDKTKYIHHLRKQGKYYFLSRPRRFGKSLLLSTMKELYAGSRELFEGLWIEDHWDWEKTNPVIHIKFASFKYKDNPLQTAIQEGLEREAERMGFTLGRGSLINPLEDLIIKANKKFGRKVSLLIDEYDKPIIDYLDDLPQAEANRETLKSLYSIIKDSDPHLELVFITGVSAFSKVSIFSDLNNLYNLSMAIQAENLLGINQEELEAYFSKPLQKAAEKHGLAFDHLLEKVKRWYNGYSWAGNSKLYNPFSLLSFLSSRQFQNFWFETGTPTFLIKEMRKHHYYDVEQVEASAHQLAGFDFEHLDPITVLFQTGYLTIDNYDERFRIYNLRYPNEEVRFSLQQYLLNAYRDTMAGNALAPVVAITKGLEAGNMQQVIDSINATFSSIPYELWQKENEHFYHALVHLLFSLMGAYVQSEVHTAQGRCDALVQTDEYIYAFEFKLDKPAAEALKQIREKGYLQPFADSAKKKVAVGIHFSTEEKKVVEWQVE